jgi:hypothetical protein
LFASCFDHGVLQDWSLNKWQDQDWTDHWIYYPMLLKSYHCTCLNHWEIWYRLTSVAMHHLLLILSIVIPNLLVLQTPRMVAGSAYAAEIDALKHACDFIEGVL